MDFKNPTLGTGTFLLCSFLFLSLYTLAAQKASHHSTDTTGIVKSKLADLIKKFEKEERIVQKRIGAQPHLKSVFLPSKERDGTVVALRTFGTDGTPLYYSTHSSPTSDVSRASSLYTGGALDLGITGKGMEVGVWDAGLALESHQEFGNRVSKADSSTMVDFHTTMVTGVIASSGLKSESQGVAFESEVRSHNWTRDRIEVAEAAAKGLLLSNHSYGIKSDRVPDWYFGSYIKISQDWDNIMYHAPYYLMVTAAGNAQNSHDNTEPVFGKAQDGFDLLLGFTTAKNGIVVAGGDTRLTNSGDLKDAFVSGYSSFGPIDDGRIKPDLAGDGMLINSTSDDGDSSYSNLRGTSMAAPGVTGSLLLLQAYHAELYGSYMKAATLKGLALHTADDVQEPGPDYKMGWGVLNTKRAAEVLVNNDYGSLVTQTSLASGESYSITVKAHGNEPLLASISWTDPASEHYNKGELNETTPALVNDLDIRITKDGKTYFPWKLEAANASAPAVKGDNRVDPFERIDILEPQGEYTITVTHKGNLVNSQQDFSLLVSGVQLTNCNLAPPTDILLDGADENSASWYWGAVEETLYEVQTKASDTEAWVTQLTWQSSTTMQDLEQGKNYTIRIRAVCTENLVSEFSNELNFEFNGVHTQPMNIFAADTASSLSVFPNPAKERMAIHNNTTENATYRVTTLSGFIIKQGRASETINVSDLATGMYLISVNDNGKVTSTKFFKK